MPSSLRAIWSASRRPTTPALACWCLARTIADLEGTCAVTASHVAEAIHARLLDREIDAPAAA